MRETKCRIEHFAFYDHSGIARHLERMAEMGWMLEKIGALPGITGASRPGGGTSP